VLRKLAAVEHPTTIAVLAPWWVHGEPEQRRIVHRTLSRLLDEVPVASLQQLDEALRRGFAWFATRFRASFTAAQVGRLVASSTDPGLTLRLLASHPDGQVREAVVRRLRLLQRQTAIPTLLLRTSDWAGPVAEAARAALSERIQERWIDVWCASMPLVLHQRRLRRGAVELVDRVEALIAGHASLEHFEIGLYDPHAPTRRWFWNQLCESQHMPSRAWLALGREHMDVVIRRDFIRRLRQKGLPPGQVWNELIELMQDAHAGVRLDALRALLAGFPERSGPIIRDAVFDRSAAVRAAARFHLAQQVPQTDFAAAYRARLARPDDDPRAALSGLSETGRPDDVHHLLPYLDDARQQVRRTAVIAAARLSADCVHDRVLAMLEDAVGAVSAAARRMLSRDPTRLDADSLLSLIGRAPFVHVRRNALILLAAMSYWASLPQLLQSCRSSDESIRMLALPEIERRSSRSRFPPLSARQAERILAALEEASAVVPEELAELLRFSIKASRQEG